jgi:hypothetical protein
MIFVLQVNEAVGRVAASERINGNIYALTIESSVSYSPQLATKFENVDIHRHLGSNEQRLDIFRFGRVRHVAYVEPPAIIDGLRDMGTGPTECRTGGIEVRVWASARAGIGT